MSVTIRRNVPGAKLREAVPPAYRGLVSEKVPADGTYTLLLFAHTERDVVTSQPVRKAFRRLEADPARRIVAVGTTFTDEALQILHAHGATLIRLRASEWTDTSAAQRQL